MKKAFFAFTMALVAATATMLLQSNSDAPRGTTTTDKTGFTYSADDVKHGAYLVTIMVCDDCHSPKTFGPGGPEPDPARRLSGRPSDQPVPSVDTAVMKDWVLMAPDLTATAGPWGISFSANLTSDETGIGNWTFEQFKTAIRKGKYKGLEGARDLLPPMPWPQYRHLSDEDLHDIFAFLKSTKPVRNIVPAPIPPNKLVH